MPELPEVEIITNGLRQKLIGQTISRVDVRAEKLFQGKVDDILNAKIESIERRAKMILIHLSNRKSLLIHLKMTGQLVFDRQRGNKLARVAGGHPSADWVADLPTKFTHVILEFKDGGVLYFNDLRKFGYIKVYKTVEIGKLKVLNDLGPEPFDSKFTPEYLMQKISKRPKIKIKQILLDQTVISGIGNIYADETLFCARISPLRIARDVTRTELIRIIECAKTVLRKAIRYGGSSENTFVHSDGRKGQMQNHFNVYRKTGQPCPICNGSITRIVISGRGTHYCPDCQI